MYPYTIEMPKKRKAPENREKPIKTEPKPPKKKRLCYPRESVPLAVKEVREGKRISEVARKYGIPESTIRAKNLGLYPDKKPGPSTVLTQDEEQSLVDWIFYCSDRGFHVTKNQLLESVRLNCIKTKRVTPFINNTPGRAWYESFLKRHSEVVQRINDNYTQRRTKVSEDTLWQWFEDSYKYLSNENAMTIGPNRIFTCAETKISLNPVPPSQLFPRDDPNGQKTLKNYEKENMTILVTCSADGNLAPTYILFTEDSLPNNVATMAPNIFAFGLSETNSLTAQNFYEYITTTFESWLIQNQIERPVILYLDSATYMTLQLSKFCTDHRIILIALHPNATHVIQPLEITLFQTLKTNWLKICEEFCRNSLLMGLHKYQLAPILQRSFESINIKAILQEGFKKSGLYPFDPNAVDLIKTKRKIQTLSPKSTIHFEIPLSNNRTLQNDSLKEFEKFLNKSQIQSFQLNVGPIWRGEKKDEGLFNIWYKLLHSDKLSNIPENQQVNTTLNTPEFIKINGDFNDLNSFLVFHS